MSCDVDKKAWQLTDTDKHLNYCCQLFMPSDRLVWCSLFWGQGNANCVRILCRHLLRPQMGIGILIFVSACFTEQLWLIKQVTTNFYIIYYCLLVFCIFFSMQTFGVGASVHKWNIIIVLTFPGSLSIRYSNGCGIPIRLISYSMITCPTFHPFHVCFIQIM